PPPQSTSAQHRRRQDGRYGSSSISLTGTWPQFQPLFGKIWDSRISREAELLQEGLDGCPNVHAFAGERTGERQPTCTQCQGRAVTPGHARHRPLRIIPQFIAPRLGAADARMASPRRRVFSETIEDVTYY